MPSAVGPRPGQMRGDTESLAILARMLAAEVWHWWIGVALTGGIALLFIALIGAYMKSVSSQKYPGGKRRRQSDL
jgi:hypothetical protein